LRGLGDEVIDVGNNQHEPVDYPDLAEAVGKAVLGRADRGVLRWQRIGGFVGATKKANSRRPLSTLLINVTREWNTNETECPGAGARVIGPAMRGNRSSLRWSKNLLTKNGFAR